MNIKKRTLLFASRAGLEQELIEAYERLGGISWSEYPLDEELRNYELSKENRKGDVLFTLIPAYGSLCYRFGVLGHAFRTRGYRPIILYDDSDLPTRPEFTINNTDQTIAVQHRYRAQKFGKEFGFKSASIGELVGSSTYDHLNIDRSDLSYCGVPLSNCAKASTRKYLKRYSLDLSDPQVRTRYEQFLRGGAMLVDASKMLFDTYDFAATVVNEPNYIQGAVPLAVSKDEGVNTYTNKWGYQAGQIMFGRATNRHYMAQFTASNLMETILDRELTEQELKDVDEILARWRDNEITKIDYTTGTGQSVDTDADTFVGLFTNLLWDGALEPDQALYNDVYGWLADTIDVFENLTEMHLVIKPHPAEHIRGTNESVGDWIRAAYEELPANVTLLPSDTDVDTYELFTDLDLGIVYASTVGLEMVYDGVPVVTSGYPPYHGFNITYDPDTTSEYQEYVKQAGEITCSTERQARARRYFHFLFFCKHFDFPYHGGTSVDNKKTNKSKIKHHEIAPGNEPWDSIVQQILDGEEVLHPDCQKLKQ